MVATFHRMIITPRNYGQMCPAASHQEQRLLPIGSVTPNHDAQCPPSRGKGFFLGAWRKLQEGYTKDEEVSCEENIFSNSLIIHQVKTLKITTVKEVWIPGLN